MIQIPLYKPFRFMQLRKKMIRVNLCNLWICYVGMILATWVL